MKHLLILFSLALFVAGCSNNSATSGMVYPTGTYAPSAIETYTIKGHEYIVFYRGGITHSASCPCHSRTLTEWQQLQLAIAITESRCNPNATGATQDFGILQLTPIYVKEANRVGGTEYAHEDAYDPLKSLSMFQAVQDYHNPEHDQNKAIKLHNKAPWYAQRVKDNLEFVQRYEAVRSLL